MSRPDNQHQRETVRQGFVNLGVGEAFARLIAFAATAYLARQLGAGVYGSIVLATTVLLYVARVTDGGIDLLGVSEVAQDPSRLTELLPKFVGVRLALAVVSVLVLSFVGLALLPQPDGAIMAVYALTLLPTAVIVRWAHLGLTRSGIVSISRIATELVTTALVVILVRDAGHVARVPLAVLLGESIGAFLLLRALPQLRTNVRELLRVDAVIAMYRRSWSVVLYSLLGLVIYNSDFFFLRIYRDAATVGHYAVAYALVSFFTNVGNVYSTSLLPVVARLRADPEGERRLFHDALAQLFAAALPIAVGGCLVADRLVDRVFGPAFGLAVIPLQILIWSVPLSLVRGVAQSLLVARDRRHDMLRSVSWAAALNLTLNLALIPPWGTTGAAVATSITNLTRAYFMFGALRSEGLPMAPFRRLVRPMLGCALMAAVLYLLPDESVERDILVGATTYLLTLLLTGGIRLRRGALPEIAL